MKHQISLSLTDEELEKLKSLLEKNNLENVSSTLLIPESKEVSNDEYIENEIYKALSFLSGLPPHKFSNKSHLVFDLGLRKYHKSVLAGKFHAILKDLGHVIKISPKECESLTTVGDCINLLKSKVK